MKILKNSKYNIIKKDHQCNEDEEREKKKRKYFLNRYVLKCIIKIY